MLFFYGIRGIDDIVLRHRDEDETGIAEEKTYYLTDANGNVVMTVDDEAYGIERIFYRAYGNPECFPWGDVNGDHIANASDATTFNKIKDGGANEKYNLLGDVDLDGDDLTYMQNNRLGRSGGHDVLSVAAFQTDPLPNRHR